ncbi:DNA-directed RNA polymerase subunit E'' [archaeon]|nr:DNA-directed RNA polymerase subunit E'' [archaeon]
MKEKACKECSKVTTMDICTICKAPTSTDWIGYVSIVDPETSEIAKRLNIKIKGKYALRVK